MSVVTNLIISLPYETKNLIEQMQQAIKQSCTREQEFVCITDGDLGGAWGGHKYPECELWAGAFNYLSVQKFYSLFVSIAWKDPESVQIFIKDQEDYKWSLLGLEDLKGGE